MSAPQIIGWAHRPFGRLEQPSIESLLASVCGAALEDAGLGPADIDAVSVGVYNNVPRRVLFWDELARSGYRKGVRRTVREMLLGTGRSGDGRAP